MHIYLLVMADIYLDRVNRLYRNVVLSQIVPILVRFVRDGDEYFTKMLPRILKDFNPNTLKKRIL